MKDSKAVLVTLIIAFLISNIAWFSKILPPGRFKSYLRQAPGFVDDKIISIYPDDLVVTIKNGQVDINQDSPYCLITHHDQETGQPFGIVYDSAAIANPSIFTQKSQYQGICNPIALVGKDFFMYPDNNNSNQYKINTIPDSVDYQLDKDTITDFADKTLPKVMDFGQKIYFFIPIIIFALSYPFILLFNFWYTFVLRLAFKLFKVDPKLTQGKVYGTSLLIYFLILLTQTITGGRFISFPFFNTIAICLFAILYFKSRSPNPPDNDQTPAGQVK